MLIDSAVSEIADALSAAICIRGFALLAVDGSGDFETMFNLLSRVDISWNRVVIVLQRYDVHDDQAVCSVNMKVREMLLCNNARSATFIPSQYEKIALPDVASIMSADIEPLLPIDVVVRRNGMCEPALKSKFMVNHDLEGICENRANLFSILP